MKKQLYSAALVALLVGVPALAGDAPLARVSTTAISVDLYPSFARATAWQLTIAGPDGFYVQQELSGSVLSIDARSFPDGDYNWELRPILPRKKSVRGDRNAIRPSDRSLAQFGFFRIVDGVIPDALLEESSEGAEKDSRAAMTDSGAGMSRGAPALEGRGQTFATDVVVQGSLCVGFDCVSSESFGADTIRVKENNLRIHFDDTSNSASFPKNDWRLTANDSSNGGAERFSIDDATAGRSVFTIEAGAPSNSLYVDNAGLVGFGTNNPVVELHVKDGDSPALRLEQDGSSGFQAQTWDVAGNETNFFVRDVTNGSKLPFKIIPSAPTNSLYVAADGDVGLGTASPDDALHVQRTSSGANLKVEGTGAGVILEATGAPANERVAQIFVSSAGVFRMRGLMDGGGQSVAGIALDLGTGFVGINDDSPSGTLDVNGTIFLSGSQIHPDFVFEPDYDLESIEDHAAFMWENKHLPALAPARYNEDGKRVIELGENTAGMLEELEKAHIYIERLHGELREKGEEVSELSQRLARLEELFHAESSHDQR